MKLQGKIISLLVLLLIFGCAKNESISKSMAGEKTIAAQSVVPKLNVERKLVKEGSVAFETDDINATRKIIFERIKKYKAYVSSDREYKTIGEVSNTINIRIPAKNFDLLLNDVIKGVTKIDSKDIEVKDVTETFLDIQARLKTKKELENSYLELLKKTNSVTEILEIEKQVGQLRSEI